MIFEYTIVVCGIGSAAFLGYITWKNRPAAVSGRVPGLSPDVVDKYSELDRKIGRIVSALAITLGLGVILRECGIFNEDIVESTRENKPGDGVSPVHGAVDIFASNDQSSLPAHLLMWVCGDH